VFGLFQLTKRFCQTEGQGTVTLGQMNRKPISTLLGVLKRPGYTKRTCNRRANSPNVLELLPAIQWINNQISSSGD
jgi:hypothetical protein